MKNNNGQIIIAGAGVGGLATALALARHDIPSTVLERKKESSEDGAGIQIGPNGTRVLNDIGVLDALRPYVGIPENIIANDARTAQVIAELPLGNWIKQRHGYPYWVAHRVDLQKVLFSKASDNPLISIEMDSQVTNVETHQNDSLTVLTKQGKQWDASILIGADGLWSRTRNFVLNKAAPEFTPKFFGKSAARTVIPISQLNPSIRHNAVTLWMSPQAHLVHYPIRGGKELAIIAVRNDSQARQSWGSPVDSEWVLKDMDGFHQEARALISSTQNWRVWGLHTFPPLDTFVRGRVGLIGDAAHPVLPFLAQGAVMALEDALIISQHISRAISNHGNLNATNVNEALQEYQSRRRPRVQKIQQRSMRQGKIYHMSGLMAHARNLTMRLAPPEKLMAGYDWLYGWRAELINS